jgi:hypothetical protein
LGQQYLLGQADSGRDHVHLALRGPDGVGDAVEILKPGRVRFDGGLAAPGHRALLVTLAPMSCAASSSASRCRPKMNTCAPSLTNRSALASPMPLSPPVMTATLPPNLDMTHLQLASQACPGRC